MLTPDKITKIFCIADDFCVKTKKNNFPIRKEVVTLYKMICRCRILK
jgi:hypothetical protein